MRIQVFDQSFLRYYIVAGLYDYFPTVFPNQDPVVVVNLESVFGSPDSIVDYDTWMTLEPGADPKDVLASIQTELKLIPAVRTDAVTQLHEEQEGIERVGLFGVLNVGFLTAGLMPAIGFVLYSYASMRRRFIQLGILQAIGLSVRQMVGYLASEQLILMSFAIAGGALVGLAASSIFVPFLQSEVNPVPPFQIFSGLGEAAWLSIVFRHRACINHGRHHRLPDAAEDIPGNQTGGDHMTAETVSGGTTNADGANGVSASANGVNQPLINCDNLVKIYKVAELEVVALQGLELTVPRGEMLGIIGASGSGKTTLMNILGGLDRPTAGKVIVNQQDLLKLSDREINEYRRTQVGFVWQQTGRNLIPYLSALENIRLPMTMAWMSEKEKREWSKELLHAVGLYERRFHKLVQLSGGEQQRVSIAVALANKPVMLLGDEPTGEVDSATAQRIIAAFQHLRELFNLTILIVTHDPRIAGMVDRVVAIRDGKTSTETIRQVAESDQSDAEIKAVDGQQTEGQVTFHEYVVLDGAGRLQVPREYLETLDIHDRAVIDMEGDRIVIRAVNEGARGAGKTTRRSNGTLSLDDQVTALFAEEPLPEKKKKTSSGIWTAPSAGSGAVDQPLPMNWAMVCLTVNWRM